MLDSHPAAHAKQRSGHPYCLGGLLCAWPRPGLDPISAQLQVLQDALGDDLLVEIVLGKPKA